MAKVEPVDILAAADNLKDWVLPPLAFVFQITEDFELWFALIVGKDHPLREINHEYRIASNINDDTAVFEPCQIIELLSRDLMEELPNGLVKKVVERHRASG